MENNPAMESFQSHSHRDGWRYLHHVNLLIYILLLFLTSFFVSYSFSSTSSTLRRVQGKSVEDLVADTIRQHEVYQPSEIVKLDFPIVKVLNAQCSKDHIKIFLEFDRPFYGVVYSKNYHSIPECVHMPPGSGKSKATFNVYLGACGTTSNYYDSSQPGFYVENTIQIQHDPQVQESTDLSQKVRCSWYDTYEKQVNFAPFNVKFQNEFTTNFLGDKLQSWMQIQQGEGPWASPVTGVVKLGKTLTMVIGVREDSKEFDVLIKDCYAHDGTNHPIQLVDRNGCIVRANVMSPFMKVKTHDPHTSVLAYAFFKAFKFPDSINVYFQCTVLACRGHCPSPKCQDVNHYYAMASERILDVAAMDSEVNYFSNASLENLGRSISNDTEISSEEEETTGGLKMRPRRDADEFLLNEFRANQSIMVIPAENDMLSDIEEYNICMPIMHYHIGLAILAMLAILTMLQLFCFQCVLRKSRHDSTADVYHKTHYPAYPRPPTSTRTF